MSGEHGPDQTPEPGPNQVRPLPRVKLIDRDGNAFSILGACKKSATRAGWTPDQWAAFHTEATSRDYNHLLATVIRHFDIE